MSGAPKNPEHSAKAEQPPKKDMILTLARDLGAKRFTPAEIEQIRRQMVTRFGPGARTSAEYIATVLSDAGMRVALTRHADELHMYEEELRDLLHFSTLEEAEMCLIRLDELVRKFRVENLPNVEESVRDVARLGRRRAEMIARNRAVEEAKREEKEEIANWFAIWLETPDAFFDWLELRKQSPEFRARFPQLPEDDE
jgi:hypothetical protein